MSDYPSCPQAEEMKVEQTAEQRDEYFVIVTSKFSFTNTWLTKIQKEMFILMSLNGSFHENW